LVGGGDGVEGGPPCSQIRMPISRNLCYYRNMATSSAEIPEDFRDQLEQLIGEYCDVTLRFKGSILLFTLERAEFVIHKPQELADRICAILGVD